MKPTELHQLSASDLSRGLAQGQFKAEEVMTAFLDQTEKINPGINALVSLRPRAELIVEARAADGAERKGWLHGIPFAIKDLVATKGLKTTWGSPLFANHVPDRDDLVAARVRAAGAILVGKTNTPEWGQGSHTFNTVFGTTRNPYDLTRSAGGSSGGAAAALAARLLSVADGSDMMGSLRNPAAFCNVYGFRPTFGLVPNDNDGDVFLRTLATEGPMARTIEDIARLLETLSGPNPETPFGRPSQNFSELLEMGLKGIRIGWLGDWGGAYECEPGILDLNAGALKVFEEQGALIETLSPPFPAEDLWRSWITLRAAINANSMKAHYENPASRALLKPETIWEIEQGQQLSARDVYEASAIRSKWFAHAARLFEHFDALAMPAAQVWPFPAEWRWPKQINRRAMDTYHRWMEVVVPVSLIGLPSLCLPAGFGPGGLPTGFQLVGPTGADARILALGQTYHKATDWPGKRPPNNA